MDIAMSRNDEPVEITYDTQLADTDKALLFRIGDAKVWIPKSQITSHNGKTFEIPEWLAVAKELV
jgi:hypothetical protein